MITKISAELAPLTHELAVQISTMPPVPGERDKKLGRLKFFERHLKNKTFGSPTWSIAIVKESGEQYRADGQHTSTVLANVAPVEFPEGLQVTIQRFEIDSLENDAPSLFDMFDNPQSARSNTDAMSIYRARYEEISHLSNPLLVKVATGIDYYLDELPLDPEHPTLLRYVRRQFGMYYEIPQHREFANWLHQWETARHAWMIGKAELVAEMFFDWKSFPAIATTFWGHVLREDHPDAGDETRELAAKLKDLATKKKLKRDTFRNQARKGWDRYRKFVLATQESLPTTAETIPQISPSAIPTIVRPDLPAGM